MDGNVEDDEKETTRPVDLLFRVFLSMAGLVALLVLSQLAG